jgi:hypothetical protein
MKPNHERFLVNLGWLMVGFTISAYLLLVAYL